MPAGSGSDSASTGASRVRANESPSDGISDEADENDADEAKDDDDDDGGGDANDNENDDDEWAGILGVVSPLVVSPLSPRPPASSGNFLHDEELAWDHAVSATLQSTEDGRSVAGSSKAGYESASPVKCEPDGASHDGGGGVASHDGARGGNVGEGDEDIEHDWSRNDSRQAAPTAIRSRSARPQTATG